MTFVCVCGKSKQCPNPTTTAIKLVLVRVVVAWRVCDLSDHDGSMMGWQWQREEGERRGGGKYGGGMYSLAEASIFDECVQMCEQE